MGEMGRTAILIPSLGRAQFTKRVFGNIEANTPEPHDQLWCVTGDDYKEPLIELGVMQLHDGGLLPESPGHLFIDDGWNNRDEDYRYVTRMNKLCRVIRGLGWYDYVFFGSDDVYHHPIWLSHALDVMANAPDAQVVVVNDLRNPNGTQALVRMEYLPKAVFDDPDAAFHTGYLHNFADTEMFRTAAEHGVIYRAPDSHVEHLHPLQSGSAQRPWDKTYADAQANWDHDAKLFHERMESMKAALAKA